MVQQPLETKRLDGNIATPPQSADGRVEMIESTSEAFEKSNHDLSHDQMTLHIDPQAEAKLRRKIDFFVIPTAAMLYLLCFIDRTNIGNAKLVGFEKDLNMKGLDYNAILSVFYISYIVFEPPAAILCKKIGPGWFLPGTSLGFGIMSICTAFVTDFSTCAACRFLLGVFEAGVMPGIAYYLSRWYRHAELTYRLSLYVVFAPLAGAFGGLLAGAILKIPSFGSLHSWRLLFAVEGLITILFALIAFFTCTDRPETARWLSAEEKKLAADRLMAERVGTTEVLDKMDLSKLRRGLANPVTIMTSVIYLLDNVTVQGLAFFAPTIVRTIYPQHHVIQQQLRTAPPYIVGAFFTVLFPWLSWKTNKKSIWFIPCGCLIIVGYIIFLSTTNGSARYAATFFIASGAFPFGALANAHVAANTISDTSRSTAIATVVLFGHIGGFCSSWSFTPKDGPVYPIGSGLNLGTSTTLTILTIVMIFWIRRDNKKRRQVDSGRVLQGMTSKKIQDLDWKHPDFRWKL